jgi:hypothetical protein
MSRKFALLFFLPLVPVLAVASRTASPGQDYYMDPSQVDLIHILAPPLLLTRTKAKQTCKRYWRRSLTGRRNCPTCADGEHLHHVCGVDPCAGEIDPLSRVRGSNLRFGGYKGRECPHQGFTRC